MTHQTTSATSPTSFGIDDYPALFAGADTTSRAGQAWYTGFVRADLILVVAAAAVSALPGLSPNLPQPAVNVVRGVSVALLILALFARTTNRIRRPEKEWFDGRAVAETTKSAAWKYTMRAPPYVGPESDADLHLTADLRSLIEDRNVLPYASAVLSRGGEQITSRMRAIRAMPWRDRREVYMAERVNDQQRWYAGKAQANRAAGTVWFWIGWLGQGVALAMGIVNLVLEVPGLIGVFTSVAAAVMAWTQLRHHDELAQSYSVAAQELSLSASELRAAPDESAFLTAVQQAEDAISREHKLWVARRQ